MSKLKKFEKVIIERYNRGDGTCELARDYQVNRGSICSLLKRNNIDLRRFGSNWKLKHNKKYFSEYNAENCYWAGFILADGNVGKNGKVLQMSLQNKDVDHLRKFTNDLNCDGAIYPDGDCSKFSLWSSALVKDLETNFSVHPRKTYDVEFPNQVPEEYWKDIVRGIFDGDGSITSNGKGCLMINFTGTSKLLNFLRNYFRFKLNIIVKNKDICNVAPICSCSNEDKTSQVAYSSKNAITILNWMYENSDQYLSRKYQRYLQVKDFNGRILKYNDEHG